MNQDTTNFLTTLLWLAYNEEEPRRFTDKTIGDFSPAFVAAIDGFVAAFRAHCNANGYSDKRLNDLQRSFGGNCYLSLSGHGAGFFDERDDELADLHKLITAWAGGSRFEELESMLDIDENGTIDLAILPDHIDAYRTKLFAV